MKRFFWIATIIILLIYGCNGNKNDNKDKTTINIEKYDSKIEIYSPLSGSTHVCGDEIDIDLRTFENINTKPDSIEIYANEEYANTLFSLPAQTKIKTSTYPVGIISFKFIIYKEGKKDYKTVSSVLLSDITPIKRSFKIINTYPHDEGAYTQGLVYEDGFFYEGTGDWGHSSLRKVNAKTGEIIKIYRLPDKIFGEGIAVLSDVIFQITYKAQKGYIYNKETFEITQDFYYNFKEGWGLTKNDEYIIMSDGTSNIYFLDTIHFTEASRVQVFNNLGPVAMLNELEYIDGKIFANLYGETQIVIINPANGKIEEYLECKDLVPNKYKNSQREVLNGIAYNPANKHLYLTGKDWPVLYEIELE